MLEVTDIQTGFFQMLSIAMADNNQSYKIFNVYCNKEVESDIRKKLAKMFNIIENTHHIIIHDVHIVFRNDNDAVKDSDYLVIPIYKSKDKEGNEEDIIKSFDLKDTCKTLICISEI